MSAFVFAAGGTGTSTRCITCRRVGHDWRKCTNECAMCGEKHSGGKCPIWTSEYPLATFAEKAQSLSDLRAKARDLETRNADIGIEETKWAQMAAYVKKQEKDYAVKQNPELAAKEEAAEAAEPKGKGKEVASRMAFETTDNEGAALKLFDPPAKWKEIVPNWREIAKDKQRTIKRELNAQAVGEVEMPQDSPLRIALVAKNRPLPVFQERKGKNKS